MRLLSSALALALPLLVSASSPTLTFTFNSQTNTNPDSTQSFNNGKATFAVNQPGTGVVNPAGGGFLGLTVAASAPATLYVSTSIPAAQDWLEVVFARGYCPIDDQSYADYTQTRVPLKESITTSALLCIKAKPAVDFSSYRGTVILAVGSVKGPKYIIDVEYDAFPSPTITFSDPSGNGASQLSQMIDKGTLVAQTVSPPWVIAFSVAANTPQGYQGKDVDLDVSPETPWLTVLGRTYTDPNRKSSGTFQVFIDSSKTPASATNGFVSASVGGGPKQSLAVQPQVLTGGSTPCISSQIGGGVPLPAGGSVPYRNYLMPGENLATISWFAPGTPSGVDVTIGSTTGTLFGHSGAGADGVSLGSASTGGWAQNGMTFYLLDSQSKTQLGQYTIGSLPQFSASASMVNSSSQVTLSWYAPGSNPVEIHVNTPTGNLFTSGANAGSATTGPWAGNGMWFYLVDASSKHVINSLVLGGSQPTIQVTPPYAIPGGQNIVQWYAPGHSSVRVMEGSDGVLADAGGSPVAQGGSSGQTATFTWAANGQTFFLVDANSGLLLDEFTVGEKPFFTQQIVDAANNHFKLLWSALGVDTSEIHVDAPDGGLFARGSPAGSLEIQQLWAPNGRGFFLVDGTSGNTASCATALAAAVFGIGGVSIPTVGPSSTLTLHVVDSAGNPMGQGVPVSVNGAPLGTTDETGSVTGLVPNGTLYVTASSPSDNRTGAIHLPEMGRNKIEATVVLW